MSSVRVAVDQDHVRPLRDQQLLDRAEHLRGLSGVTAGSDAQMEVRLRDAEFLEEHVAHRAVVVLARVDEHLLVPLA
jgi:hypothetical protein